MPEATPRSSEIRPYDFRRPFKAAVHVTEAIEPALADFASVMMQATSAQLHAECAISLHLIESIRYEDFLYSLGATSCLGVLRFDPPGAQGCIDLPLPLIYPMIDRLLGGRGDEGTPIPNRPLTQIERCLALQIIERAAGGLADTWSRVSPIRVREEAMEFAPASVRIMPADEIVLVARFDVRFGENGAGEIIGTGVSGTMSLCVPAPVVDHLCQGGLASGGSIGQREQAKADMTRNILDSAVELRALLAETKLRLSDVLTMQAGDVITTDAPADGAADEVPISLQAKEKFAGRLGHVRGTRAVRITRMAHESGDLP